MALPWLQIVQLVPSIVDVSRELLKKNKPPPPAPPGAHHSITELSARVSTLEENERNQAELVSRMAEQLSVLTKMVVELRTRLLWSMGIAAFATVVAVVAIVLR